MAERRKPAAEPARKDRLIQTRVPRDLEETLKEEARRRRLSVSHLIRNVLEDTFHLVDGVVTNVDQIVSDSVRLARAVGRGALGADERTRRRAGRAASPPAAADDLSHVYAWSEVVLHRSARCSRCRREIARGDRGFTGLSDDRDAPRAWLCGDCVGSLAASPDDEGGGSDPPPSRSSSRPRGSRR